MLKNDKWIILQATKFGMIYPFEQSSVREIEVPNQMSRRKVLSYGCSSFGYDIRLSPKEFLVFKHIPGTVIDPKNFNPRNLEPVPLQHDENGHFFVLPAHSYGLGVAIEKLEIPSNITAICVGKSTYARCSLILNVTPAESRWKGNLTLEVSNSSGADCRIYANEGIAQLLFLEGENCLVSYADRQGKYQNQPHEVILPRV